MPIGPELLLQLVKEIKLVENLSERELERPEGAGFDLRVGAAYKFKLGYPFLAIDERRTPDIELIAKYGDARNRKNFVIFPSDYFLITTLEKVNLPKDLAGYTFPRSTLFRCGLELLHTQVAPGYQGELTFGLKNIGSLPVSIELGARVVHIQFERVEGGGIEYRGQWKGGRVSAKKKEKQV